MKTEIPVPPTVSKGINRLIENMANKPAAQRILQKGIEVYVSDETVVDGHSGVTKQTYEEVSNGYTPLEALIISKESKQGRKLTEKEITTIYINSLIGGLIELGARKVLRSPTIKKHQGKNIKRLAQWAYDKADWDTEYEPARTSTHTDQQVTSLKDAEALFKTINALLADKILTEEEADEQRQRVKEQVKRMRERQQKEQKK